MDWLDKVKGVLSYRVDDIFYRKSFSLDGSSAIPHGQVVCRETAVSHGFEFRLSIKPERKKHLVMEQCEIMFSLDREITRCFVNGFQSWTESREISPWDTQKKLNPLFKPWISKYHLSIYGDQHFFEYPNKPCDFHGYTYGYLRHADNSVTLAGSLSEKTGYTCIRFQIEDKGLKSAVSISKDCEGDILTREEEYLSLYIGNGPEYEVFNQWDASEGVTGKQGKTASGWTSWYNHYEKIDEKILIDNLQSFSERGIPLDFFQIDDGWQTAVGDWLKVKECFPDGMGAVARNIRNAGYRPGIWLAPFAAEESSILCRDHADWIVRDEHGPVRAGYNTSHWSGSFYGLDICNPEVKEYLKNVFHTIFSIWKFDMAKVDFLYAAAIRPRNGKSRGRIMYEGMQFLREVAGDRILLGCGVPLGSAFSKVDYCRIGADVALTWEDRRLKTLRYNERVSTVNSLASAIGRHHLDLRFFRNDPDVFILREEHNKLSHSRKQVLFFVKNLFGGLVFTSDNLDTYTEKQMHHYGSAFPYADKDIRKTVFTDPGYEVDFAIGNRKYFAYINYSGQQGAFTLPGDDGTLWFSEQQGIKPGGWGKKTGGYETACFVKVQSRPWSVAGTTGRMFPASEIEQIYREENELTISFRERTLNVGDVVVRLPRGVEICMINNNSALIEECCGVIFGRASLIY